MSPQERTLDFAMLGCGRMGHIHVRRLLADGRGRVVALFDKDTNAIEALQHELVPDARGFTDLDDLHLHCEEADLLLRDWQIWIGRNNSLEPLKVAEPRWQSALGLNPFAHPELDLLGNPVSGFLDQLLLGAPTAAPPECALPVFDFTQAVLRSSQSGVVERV
jgi:hypothetical protein